MSADVLAIVLAMALALAVAGCVFRVRRYRKWLRVPVARDDILSCRDNYRGIGLIVGPDGFDVPQGLALRGRTVLLRISIRVPLLLRMYDPYIEIGEGRGTCRQYFERGAAGPRYLNLSPLFACEKVPVRINLRGGLLRWGSEAALLVFEPPPIDGADVLVLAPHPDDAEIAAFGLYASRRSWIVTVTAGEKATGNLPQRIPAQARPRWAAMLRVLDSLTVPQLGQVPPERSVNLVFPDGALESMYREPDRAFNLGCEASLPRLQLRGMNTRPEFRRGGPGCCWNDLVTELQLLLELVRPDVIVCPHPLIDTHPDHVFTTMALEQALRSLTGKRPLLLLYTVHSHAALLYPFGPCESLVCLPPGQSVGWVAESLYSLTLEPETQQGKYFAVEAMHAARNFAEDGSRERQAPMTFMWRMISAYFCGMSPFPASLLRRAPRPNEIYYVMRGDLLTELLEQPRAAPGCAPV